MADFLRTDYTPSQVTSTKIIKDIYQNTVQTLNIIEEVDIPNLEEGYYDIKMRFIQQITNPPESPIQGMGWFRIE